MAHRSMKLRLAACLDALAEAALSFADWCYEQKSRLVPPPVPVFTPTVVDAYCARLVEATGRPGFVLPLADGRYHVFISQQRTGEQVV